MLTAADFSETAVLPRPDFTPMVAESAWAQRYDALSTRLQRALEYNAGRIEACKHVGGLFGGALLIGVGLASYFLGAVIHDHERIGIVQHGVAGIDLDVGATAVQCTELQQDVFMGGIPPLHSPDSVVAASLALIVQQTLPCLCGPEFGLPRQFLRMPDAYVFNPHIQSAGSQLEIVYESQAHLFPNETGTVENARQARVRVRGVDLACHEIEFTIEGPPAWCAQICYDLLHATSVHQRNRSY